MTASINSVDYLSTLRESIIQSFNQEELRTLAHDLRVDIEQISGDSSKLVLVRSLIIHLARRERLPDLIEALRKYRPGQEWQDLPLDFELPEIINYQDIPQWSDNSRTRIKFPDNRQFNVSSRDGEYLQDLGRQIGKSFDLEELRTLTLDFGIDYDSFVILSKSQYIEQLILYLAFRQQLYDFIQAMYQLRPNKRWPGIPQDFKFIDISEISAQAPATSGRDTEESSPPPKSEEPKVGDVSDDSGQAPETGDIPLDAGKSETDDLDENDLLAETGPFPRELTEAVEPKPEADESELETDKPEPEPEADEPEPETDEPEPEAGEPEPETDEPEPEADDNSVEKVARSIMALLENPQSRPQAQELLQSLSQAGSGIFKEAIEQFFEGIADPGRQTELQRELTSLLRENPSILDSLDQVLQETSHLPPEVAVRILRFKLEKEAYQNSAASDQPADRLSKDLLGFDTYVNALQAFIKSRETTTPLTIGIDGPWGSGKSSLMRMLKDELSKDQQITTWFNAWKFDQEEQLWAALAVSVLDQLRNQLSFADRLKFWSKLTYQHIKTWSAVWQIIIKIILPLILGFTAILYTIQLQDAAGQSPLPVFLQPLITFSTGVPWLLWIGFAITGIASISSILKDPFRIAASDILDKPNYCAKIGFIGEFEKDFQRIVDLATNPTYDPKTGEELDRKRKLVIFIDDLDRCEPPKAADIIEAINLFLDSRGCVFVLGMDSSAVIASIETKYKDLFTAVKREHAMVVSPGRLFLDKIIQVPFNLPRPTRNDINRLVENLIAYRLVPVAPDGSSSRPGLPFSGRLFTPRPQAELKAPPQQPSDTSQEPTPVVPSGTTVANQTNGGVAPLDISRPDWPNAGQRSGSPDDDNQPLSSLSPDEASYKREDIRSAIRLGANLLPENPRLVKRFINLFRLQVFIASARNLFETHASGEKSTGITLDLLAAWVAWSIRWPAMTRYLTEEASLPAIRKHLFSISVSVQGTGLWLEEKKQREFEKYLDDNVYSLRELGPLKNASHWCHLPWEWWLSDINFRKGVKTLESLWSEAEDSSYDWLIILVAMASLTQSNDQNAISP